MYNLKWIFSYQDIECFQPPGRWTTDYQDFQHPRSHPSPPSNLSVSVAPQRGHHFPSPWSEVKVTQPCPTLCDPMDYSPWNSPDQKTGVGSPSLLQGIFPTQELNQDLLHCRQILYQLSYERSPSFLSLPFSFPSLSFFFLPYFNFTFPEFHTNYIINTFHIDELWLSKTSH